MSGESILEMPSFASHEHWGSIPSIGMSPEGFRADTEAGATPNRPTSVWDLILDPYFGGWLGAAGCDPNALAKAAGRPEFNPWWREAPEAALAAIRPHLERQALTGAFQCLRLGIMQLHGMDIGDLSVENWQAADQAVNTAYSDIFGHYRKGMTKARFNGLIRPVHPEYYLRRPDPAHAKEETAFTLTVLRIDPLLELRRKASAARRKALAEYTGVEPEDARSWRTFLESIFTLAKDNGAVGIKQLQAYRRSLDFQFRPDREVTWSGDLDGDDGRVFEDWLVHACCALANDLGWPHQIHVGTHNLPESSPLPLDMLARRYPGMSLVLLHTWPFIEESGHIAKHFPNVYLDPCWLNILNPDFHRQTLETWLGYLPWHKILCGHDATSIEMATGAAFIARENVAAALDEHTPARESKELSRLIASSILHQNAATLYGATRQS